VLKSNQHFRDCIDSNCPPFTSAAIKTTKPQNSNLNTIKNTPNTKQLKRKTHDSQQSGVINEQK